MASAKLGYGTDIFETWNYHDQNQHYFEIVE